MAKQQSAQPQSVPNPAPAKQAQNPSLAEVPVATPRYPHAAVPDALKQFLTLLPGKPVPPKVDGTLLKSWDIDFKNARSNITVLSSIGLLDGSVPNENYKRYMREGKPSAVLAALIRERYKEIFSAEPNPLKNDQTVKRLFDVHGGTTDELLLLSMRETFTMLCSFAGIGAAPPQAPPAAPPQPAPNGAPVTCEAGGGIALPRPKTSQPMVAINIQLVLPEGMTEDGYDKFFAAMKKHLWPSE